jgi:CBS domain-containing protein
MKVKDIMEPIKSWLTPEMTLRQAIEVMHRSKRGHGLAVNGIVVLDQGMNLVGIVSTTDILRVIIPAHIYFEERHTHIDWQELRREKSRIAEIMKVEEVMSDDVRVVAAEETLLRCADLLLTERIRRLPVTRSDGKVVGIVYLRDVYNALTKLLVEC